MTKRSAIDIRDKVAKTILNIDVYLGGSRATDSPEMSGAQHVLTGLLKWIDEKEEKND